MILLLTTNKSHSFNWGHFLFCQELLSQFGGKPYGKDYPGWNPLMLDVDQIIEWAGFSPQLIVSFMGKYSKWVQGLSCIKIPKVHIIADYFPWNFGEEDDFLSQNKIDLALAHFNHEVFSLRGHGYRAEHLPLSISAPVFYDQGRERDIDVSAAFSLVSWAYPTRSEVLQTLAEMPIKSVLRGAGPGKYIWQQDYVDLLNRSKIMVNAVDVCRSLNFKFFEACACGAMLLTEAADDAELLGFKDGENCVVFSGMQDLKQKVGYYLSHPEERGGIARAGHELAMKRHTDFIRVGEMRRMLDGVLRQGTGSSC